MTKKKAKSKTSKEKPAKNTTRRSRPSRSKKDKNPTEVRAEISKLVRTDAAEMAAAVIGEGKKGELAPVKYLFEMANIFPEAPKGEEATEEEDCLAKMLLDKLNAPKKPVAEDVEDDVEEEVVVKADGGEAAGTAGEDGSQNPHPTKSA